MDWTAPVIEWVPWGDVITPDEDDEKALSGLLTDD